jgi:hypothetical protein
MTMAWKRKKLTNREWWEKHGPRMEETDRKLLARIRELEKQIAEEKSAREKADAA